MQNLLRKSLGLDPVKKLKTNAYLFDQEEEPSSSLSNSSTTTDTPTAPIQDTGGGYYEQSYVPETPVTSDGVAQNPAPVTTPSSITAVDPGTNQLAPVVTE